jgi:hypothetical protein
VGDDTVAEEFQLLAVGDAWHSGDPALRQAHHPFDESGVQAGTGVAAVLERVGGGPADHGGPPVEGWPVSKAERSVCPLNACFGGITPDPSDARGVGSSTTAV